MGAAGELNAPGNVWVELDDWPPAAGTVPYYLTPSGGLLSQRVFSGQVELPIDPANPVPTRGGAELFPDLVVDGRPMGAGPADQRTVEARTDVLEFSTSLLIEPVTVMGRVKVRLWVVPDTPDLDLAVRLTDVYPDGRSMLVTDGIARARMRCGDDRECLLTPGLATEITIDLWSTAIVFNAMHRIRIDISGSNAPRFEVNPNDGRDLNLGGPGVVARPKILMDAQHPSRLELPVPGAPRVPRRMMSRR
jgi:putative CocE/NonD family hydrolase